MNDTQRIAELEKTVQRMAASLDEVRKMFNMAPFIDEQVRAINARKEALSRGEAA